MFCPKCGTKNPESGKFCRSCGADLSVVSQALSGDRRDLITEAFGDDSRSARRRRLRTDPDEAWSAGVRQTVFGAGFLIISFVLFTTNVAGGNTWWWAMLFPAFTFLSSGISSMVRGRRLERRLASGVAAAGNQGQLSGRSENASLPPAQTAFIQPETAFKTGDLVPPSVVEDTTRHLSMDTEGETMTLPKK